MSSIAVDSVVIDRILRGFRTDAHVRERLPAGGTVNVDRKLPYLFAYRQPPERADAGTHRLVLGEASYVVALDEIDDARGIVLALARTGTAELGSFLVIELWSGDTDSRDFVVHGPAGAAAATTDVLSRGLAALASELPEETGVRVLHTDDRHPADQAPLLTQRECWDIGCLLIGLEVPPIFRDAATGAVYPVFLRRLRQLLSGVLRQAAFEFARVQTSVGFESYRAVGPRSFGREVTSPDTTLAEIESSYQLLLLVAPVNSHDAWVGFRDGGFARAPTFRYRLLPVDPDSLKRRLYSIDLDPVADPAMAFILRDKRDELDRQITLIADRNTEGFRYASMRLYGGVDDVLLNIARDILEQVQPRTGGEAATVSAADFAAAARAELEYYRAACPGLAAEVQIRPDLVGLMVSRGNLLIGQRLALRPARVAPLLHHEVGTHVLTYYNGRAQPLSQLCTGLADYDELQEGLAVFAEYLTGALDASRVRVLAARVIAAHSIEQGADFLETFRLLTDGHHMPPGTAFDVAERVHQSGGFTRDLIYLRGLIRLIEYVRSGGAIEPLYIGKIAAKHVAIIEELRARGYLRAPPLLPRLFEMPETARRVAAVRRGLPLSEMVSGAA